MQAVSLLAGWGCTLVSFLGTGLPLGTPPEKEEPILAYVAPDECFLYATWAAMATPSAASSNQTEQLMAEPEVQAFAAAVKRNVIAAAIAAAQKNGTSAERANQVSKTVELWLRTLFTKSGALYLARLAPRGQALDVQGGIIVKAGDSAPELDRSLTELLTSQGAKLSEVTIVGRAFHKLSVPAEAPVDVVWAAFNGYFMVGLGPNAIEDMSARIRAQKEAGWLTQLKTNLPVERRSTITYVNIKKLLDTFVPLGGPEAEKLVNAWGFKQIVSFQSVTGLDKTGMIGRSLLAIDGQPRGVLALLDEKGIVAGDLKHIPPDSMVAMAFILDLRKAYDAAMATLAEANPAAAEQAKQAIQHVQAQLGLNVPEALSALGSHWSLHVPSLAGGPMGTALVIEVRDKNRLVEIENRFLSKLPGGEIPNVGRITRTSIGGQSVSTFTPRGPALVAPAWCVTDKQLIVGLNAQAVQVVLSRQPGEKSLAEVPDVAAPLVAAGLVGGKGPLAISYYDTPKYFATTYSQAQTLLPMLGGMAQQAGIPLDLTASQLPNQATVGKHLRPSVTIVRRTSKGLETETRQTFPLMSVGPSTGVAVALLLPAVQAAREAARRQQSANNIKQQLLALHNFHDALGNLPAAYSTSKDGKRLLSWRVALLPFMEQKALYDQFHLDEPWDSEHNKQFIDKMPRTFRSPNSSAKPGMTNYIGVGGPSGVLGPPAVSPKNGSPANGIRFADIIDGTSNTIAIVEASDDMAVIWTKPDEWVPDEKETLKGLTGMRPNGFLAGFIDGHIQFIPKTIAPEMLHGAFTRNKREPAVEWPDEKPQRAAPGRAPPPPPGPPSAPPAPPRS